MKLENNWISVDWLENDDIKDRKCENRDKLCTFSQSNSFSQSEEKREKNNELMQINVIY